MSGLSQQVLTELSFTYTHATPHDTVPGLRPDRPLCEADREGERGGGRQKEIQENNVVHGNDGFYVASASEQPVDTRH